MICMEISLDGSTPRTLLLDTGNVNSTLMADTAKALGWKTDPVMKDGNAVPGYSRSGLHTVGLGKGVAESKFLVLDRSIFGDAPLPADGSLAYTLFKDRVLQIDYPHHTVRVSDVIATPPKASTDAGTLQLITFGKQGPPIVVGAPFTVNGESVHAQIDTCFTGTLLVYDTALGKLGLNKHGKPEYFPDTDGGVNMLAAPAQKLGFGKLTLIDNRPNMYFVGDGKNPVHQPDDLFEATVGNALFAHSVVTLDFHAMTLDVQPES